MVSETFNNNKLTPLTFSLSPLFLFLFLSPSLSPLSFHLTKGKKKHAFDKKNAIVFTLQPADVASMQHATVSNANRTTTTTTIDDDLSSSYNRAEWELAELGLPNDGYDYLQHLRDAGSAFMSTLPAHASAASVFFVPEQSVVYKQQVDDVDEHRMSIAAAAVRVHNISHLDEAQQRKIDIESTGVIVADAALGEDDLDILEALEQLDDDGQEELGDDFVLLANDGLVGGPTLTTERLTMLTDAQLRARADARREMLGEHDNDDDDNDDDDFDDDDDQAYDYDDDEDDDGEDDDDGKAAYNQYTRGRRSEYAESSSFVRDDRPGEALTAKERRARSEYYAQSVAESGTYERSEAGKTMRSEALQQLDQHFDEFEKQYKDDEIGDLEDKADDIVGALELESVLDQLNAARKKAHEKLPIDHGFADEAAKDEHRRATLRLAMQIMSRPDVPMVESERDERGRPIVSAKPKLETWDAESYTSLFSNTENHPAVIAPPPRKGQKARKPVSAAEAVDAADRYVRFKLTRSGVPLAGIPVRGESHSDAPAPAAPTKEADEAAAAAAAAEKKAADLLCTREKDETREQKAARKMAVKAARAEARARKKGNRVAERASAKQQANALAHMGTQTAIQL